MSLASSPDCFLRPEDRALRMLFPSVEDSFSNTFDEFFNKELYDGSDREESEGPVTGHNQLFDISPHSAPYKDDLQRARTLDRSMISPQPWRKGLWCLNPRRTSQLSISKTRKDNTSSPSKVSPSQLLNNSFAQEGSRAVSVELETTKHSRKLEIAEERIDSYFQKQNPPNLNSSSHSMRTKLRTNTCMARHDSWQRDFQNFKLEHEDDKPNQVLPVDVGDVDCSLLVKNSNEAKIHQRKASQGAPKPTTMHELQSTHSTFPILVSHASPNIARYPGELATTNDMIVNPSDPFFGIYDVQYLGEGEFFNPGQTTESLHSSNSSHESRYPAAGGNLWQAGWASAPVQSFPMHPTQYSPDSFAEVAQPNPRRGPHKIIRHLDTTHGGSELYSPMASEIGIAVSSQPPHWHPGNEFIQPMQCSPTSAYINALTPYPPLPPPSKEDTNNSPFNTPRRQRAKSSSRSPSPAVSPTNLRSRSLKQQSPTRTEQSHHRRKSIHKSGPIKDSGNDSHRNRSASRPPRTPKTPKTPTRGFGQVDFVNFTPKDAVKLLNDVAPSGSSKTRARREQEAKDKRKKLSEAAIQAVRNAGGDLSALEMAMLQGHDYEDDF